MPPDFRFPAFTEVANLCLYLLNMLMDQGDTSTLHVDGYWSEVLSCTIMTHLGDLEVKFMDFCVEVYGYSFYKAISLKHITGSC